MKRSLATVFFCCVLFLAGCGPKEPAVPATPEKSVAQERRENWFGMKLANDASIQWRDSGLGIQVLREGEGAPPQRTDKVRINYVGRLLDGTEFDRSAAGKPAVFRVQELVTGFAAGMATMRAGGRSVFYIPPHLGYGGIRAGKIPANSSLVFEVELLEINPQN